MSREGDVRKRSVRISDLFEFFQCLFVSDDYDIEFFEKVGSSNVISVGVTVDQMRARQISHRADSLQELVAECRWSIHNDDVVACHKEDRLI